MKVKKFTYVVGGAALVLASSLVWAKTFYSPGAKAIIEFRVHNNSNYVWETSVEDKVDISRVISKKPVAAGGRHTTPELKLTDPLGTGEASAVYSARNAEGKQVAICKFTLKFSKGWRGHFKLSKAALLKGMKSGDCAFARDTVFVDRGFLDHETVIEVHPILQVL